MAEFPFKVDCDFLLSYQLRKKNLKINLRSVFVFFFFIMNHVVHFSFWVQDDRTEQSSGYAIWPHNPQRRGRVELACD